MNENKMDDQGWIKNKRCATGCTFYFVVSLPCAWYVLIEVNWSVTGTVTRVRVNVTIDILSSLQDSGASLDIPLLLINTNQVAHEWSSHSNWSITHDRSSTWTVESWIPSPSIYLNEFDISERFQAHVCLIHTNWWLSPGLLPWVTSIIWLSNYLFSVQWITVTALTVALIVRRINFYTHFSKNTNLETETSLPII